MNQIQTFSYEGIGIEFELINGQVYANATAMCRPFDKTPYEFLRSDRTGRYVDALRKNPEVKFDLIMTRNGGTSPGTWVHERLILRLAAWLNVDFEIWCDDRVSDILKGVTHPVLPQTYKEALQALIEKEEQRERLEIENARLRPKADYADLVLSSASELTTTLIAKSMGLSAVNLNRKLQQLGIQYKQSGVWHLYQRYADQNFARLRTHTYSDTSGKVRTSHYLVWTESGRQFIHQRINSGYGLATVADSYSLTATA